MDWSFFPLYFALSELLWAGFCGFFRPFLRSSVGFITWMFLSGCGFGFCLAYLGFEAVLFLHFFMLEMLMEYLLYSIVGLFCAYIFMWRDLFACSFWYCPVDISVIMGFLLAGLLQPFQLNDVLVFEIWWQLANSRFYLCISILSLLMEVFLVVFVSVVVVFLFWINFASRFCWVDYLID